MSFLSRVVSGLSLRKPTQQRLSKLFCRRLTYWRPSTSSTAFTLSAIPIGGAFILSANEEKDKGDKTWSERVRNWERTAYDKLRSAEHFLKLDTREGRTIAGIIGLNAVVYGLWKIAPTSFMVRHFTCSLESMRLRRAHTALTSIFSHMGIFHMLINSAVLSFYGYEVANILTPERFVCMYIVGGLGANMSSLSWRRIVGANKAVSLGASGAVMTTMFMFCKLFPEREFTILGYGHVKARDACILWASLDAMGLLGGFGRIDFAGHLGGASMGYLYYYLTRKDLAREYHTRKKSNSQTRPLMNPSRILGINRQNLDRDRDSRTKRNG